MSRRKLHRINLLFAAFLLTGLSYSLPYSNLIEDESPDESNFISFYFCESVSQDSDIYLEDTDTEDLLKKKPILLFHSEVRFQQNYSTPGNFFYKKKTIVSAPLLIMHNLPPPIA